MASAHYHSNRVTFLRWTLPVLALLTISIAVAWPALKEMRINKMSEQSATRLKVESIAMTMPRAGNPVELQVSKPEYSGLDEDGHPYVVTATRVIQEGLQPGDAAMHLEEPTARMTLNTDEKEQVDLKAVTGFYDPKVHTLQLNGPVQVTHSTGYVLDMQDFFVNLTEGSGTTAHPVSGHGPAGTLAGEQMEMLDKGNHIILKGRSKVVLTPKESG